MTNHIPGDQPGRACAALLVYAALAMGFMGYRAHEQAEYQAAIDQCVEVHGGTALDTALDTADIFAYVGAGDFNEVGRLVANQRLDRAPFHDLTVSSKYDHLTSWGHVSVGIEGCTFKYEHSYMGLNVSPTIDAHVL